MGKTILIVDDAPSERYLLSHLLSAAGYSVAEAADGEEGFQLATNDAPDLILLDVMMPGKSGFDVCSVLKDDVRTRDIPIIFITSMTDTTDKVHGLSLGAVDYVTKPFDSTEVKARVGAHLRIRALERESLAQRQVLWRADRLSRELRLFALVWPVAILASYLWNTWTTGTMPLAVGHLALSLVGLGMVLWGDRRLKRSEDELEEMGLAVEESP